MTGHIAIIDDKPDELAHLAEGIRTLAPALKIETVFPEQRRFQAQLADVLKSKPTLVASDRDLTEAVDLLFGSFVVDECERHLVPIVQYTRRQIEADIAPRSVFSLRLGPVREQWPRLLAALASGFDLVRQRVHSIEALERARGLGEVLAHVVGRDASELELAKYATRLGRATESFRQASPSTPQAHREFLEDHLTYLCGHLLINSVLAFPGPLVSKEALAGYFAVHGTEVDALAEDLASARYTGPFDSFDAYFWRDTLDEWVASHAAEVHDDLGHERRAAAQLAIGRDLRRHDCDRCQGDLGGFWCPSTRRPVCLRADCSVDTDAWVPAGASLCRTERDFYDMFSPVVGR